MNEVAIVDGTILNSYMGRARGVIERDSEQGPVRGEGCDSMQSTICGRIVRRALDLQEGGAEAIEEARTEIAQGRIGTLENMMAAARNMLTLGI